jgi:hypothetical protein
VREGRVPIGAGEPECQYGRGRDWKKPLSQPAAGRELA